MALECTLASLTAVDQSDPDAVQDLLDTCTRMLLDPVLWKWAIGITVGCALVGAIIGLAKGRWLAGLVWGAALGPIGWVIVAFSKGNHVECSECGFANVPSAKACRRCGVNLQAAAAKSARAGHKRNDSGRGW
jgi:ribosomal protein L40E